MFNIVESQIGNVSGHLESLGRELSDQNQELERQVLTQNSDLGKEPYPETWLRPRAELPCCV